MYFPPGVVDQQIERAVFEVATNVPYALGLNRRRRVRIRSVDLEAFEGLATGGRAHAGPGGGREGQPAGS